MLDKFGDKMNEIDMREMERHLDVFAIDDAVLAVNRALIETNDLYKIDKALDRLENLLNNEFEIYLPYKYGVFSKLPIKFRSMKVPVRVYIISNSLCLEFPNTLDKNLNTVLTIFSKYIENCWAHRIQTVYDGETKTITYIIRMVAL